MHSKTFSNLFVLAKRIFYLLLLFTLCRILFYSFNQPYFSELNLTSLLSALFYGIYFDCATIILLNFAFIILFLLPFPFREHKIYQGILKFVFIVVNSIALLSNCIDLVYFKFTIKRTTADVFNFFHGGMGSDLNRLLPLFLKDYWYVFLIWGILIFLLFFIYRKTRSKEKLIWSGKEYFFQSLILLLSCAISIVLSRGGLQLRPIGIVNAGEFVDSKNIPLILNTPFSIIKSMEVKGIEPIIYFENEAELKKMFNPYHPADKGTVKRLNIFVITLESFSKEYIGALNGKQKGYTPFLDSLIPYSLVCTNAFSNGKKSIEGIPAIVASIPTWSNEPYITSRYEGNQINSLASLLKTEGYNSAFFHGGTNGTMGFDAFTKLAGYDKYYGRKEYNNDNDYDGNWGIWDEEFLQYSAKVVNTTPQPFFATLFTLTSHHPYAVPERYRGQFKDGPLEIEKTISYSDYALKRFFETSKEMPWFRNTLFVFVSDHTGVSNDPFYTNRVGNYSIPIIYYLPNSDLKGIDSTITQQIDIMPSILDYINYPKPYFAFGNSLFDTTAEHFAMTFNNESYQLYKDYFTSEYSNNKKTDLYYYKTDSLLKSNLSDKDPQKSRSMESKTKAIIQTYQQSIINNKMH